MELKKNLASSGLIASILACSMPVYAIDNDTNETTQENLSINDDAKTLSATVTYSDSAEFSVTIPKTITLDNSKSFAYSIIVKGKILPDTQINVEPIDKVEDNPGINFYMTKKEDSSKQVIVGVKQAETSWLCNEVNIENGTTKPGLISAQKLGIGEWTGIFEFKLSVTEHIHNYQEGVCTLCNNKVTSFSEASFDEIYTACIQGLAEEYYNVGDTKTITLGALSDYNNSGEQEATITIVDIAEDGYSITCMFTSYTGVPTYVMNTENTDEGGWKATEMRAWLNGKEEGDFYNALPNDLQSSIKIHSTSYDESGIDEISYCDDKVWLLSEKEVSGNSDNEAAFEQETQLTYFANYDTSYFDIDWWLRSSETDGSYYDFYRVETNGDINADNASSAHGVFPAFDIG